MKSLSWVDNYVYYIYTYYIAVQDTVHSLQCLLVLSPDLFPTLSENPNKTKSLHFYYNFGTINVIRTME